MTPITLAKRYAESLYTVCKGQQIEEEVLEELRVINTIFHSGKVALFLKTPSIPKSIKQKNIVGSLQGKINPLLLHFLKLLIEKNRSELISYMIRAYEEKMNLDRNILDVEVRYYNTVSEDYLNRIKDYLKTILNKEIKFTLVKDDSLLGGMKLSYHNTQLDGSVASGLENLKESVLSTL